MNEISQAAVAIAVQANVPINLIGEPGCGKSAFIRALGKALDLPVEVFIGSCRSPEDIGGYPLADIEAKTITMVPSGIWVRRLIDAGKGILFIDEISTLNGAMQAATLRLIQEGVAGDVALPRDVRRVAAMNPAEIAAGGFDLAAPLANRMVHISWGVDVGVVTNGFLDEWPAPEIPHLPSGWPELRKGNAIMIASFFKRFPQLVQQCPKEESKRSEPWPSVRSWYDFAIPCLAACESVQATDEVTTTLLGGAIGTGAALEFLTWRRQLDLPDPEALLNDPKEFKVYERMDKTFAVLNSVVAAATRRLTKDRWTAAWDILSSCARQGHVDIAAAAARALVRAKTGAMPNVSKQIEPFVPLLEAAGL